MGDQESQGEKETQGDQETQGGKELQDDQAAQCCQVYDQTCDECHFQDRSQDYQEGVCNYAKDNTENGGVHGA
jgi:hypothetical protein